jgi:hypothetical protein
MRRSQILLVAGFAIAVGLVLGHTPAWLAALQQDKRYRDGLKWPEPKVVTPGDSGAPPSDAIVLMDGKSFDAWKGAEKWKYEEDGGASAVSLIQTKQGFGDIQLHVEFASPKVVKGSGQGRGNNGIGLMGGRYEIQVLDSYQNPTYFEGQAAAVYNQTPPMVNASRKPGEWQTYDIVFEAPRFGEDGKIAKPALVTVLHNGVVVQNHTEIKGTTHYDQPYAYKKHAEKEPLVLLYHGDRVRFRNIWVREIQNLVPEMPGKK